MHELVKKYIEEKRRKERELFEKKKAEYLLEEGLFEKQYSSNNNYDGEYPNYDENTQKYYKQIPIEVSDEEFEEIKKYGEKAPERNSVSILLAVIAVITYMAGGIAGLILAGNDWIIGLMVLVATFIEGSMCLGFAEIIKLLHNLNNK